MKSYEEIKQQFNVYKPRVVLAVCFILVFAIGFGTGRYTRETARQKIGAQSNYTTKTSTPAQPAPVKTSADGNMAAATSSAALTSCIVKGNISSSGKKIYHIKGGAFYNTVKPEQCFNTETEALAAGFVKSSR